MHLVCLSMSVMKPLVCGLTPRPSDVAMLGRTPDQGLPDVSAWHRAHCTYSLPSLALRRAHGHLSLTYKRVRSASSEHESSEQPAAQLTSSRPAG